ncbi:hypothetical protein Clacol_009048 [Clathrus columnatus]|uniref:Plus3 domain-containing protein n=1 Tax=Clathrus columnatus TaxID=1419009 RepID=A0AAV5APM6_9AGAM|nr:hypothetical protein Clacol_009048 [Clathrus columnatus]
MSSHFMYKSIVNMSDDDIDVELLALAGDGNEKPRKKRQNSSLGKPPSAKRRKPDTFPEYASDMEPESEEDAVNPYPLEGKYKDEADRARLLQLPEFEREGVLAARLEELQRYQDKVNLENMLKAQSGGGEESANIRRKHSVKGERTKKLDELRAKRKAKEDRNRVYKDKPVSPMDHRRSASSEPELSDVTDEEGEINKEEEEDRRIQEFYKSAKPEKPTREELEKMRVSRSQISKYVYNPWFEEWIIGSWVRYLIGDDPSGEHIYRLCEVKGNLRFYIDSHHMLIDIVVLVGVVPTAKNYKVDDVFVNRMLELSHGKAVKVFPMDKVSNSTFTDKEYDRIMKVLEDEKVDFPSRRALDKKMDQLRKLPDTPLTEADITVMIAQKNAINPGNVSITQAFNRKVELTQQRHLALKRQDYKEVAEIEKELESLASTQSSANGRRERNDPQADLMAKVNERNRRANLEAVRKAEAELAARKRQERRVLANAVATGSSLPIAIDMSARVKTVPRIHHDSRLSTPQGTPLLKANDSAERSVSPLPPTQANGLSNLTKSTNGSTQASVIDSIHVELDDF